MPDWGPSLVIALIGALAGIGAFVQSWLNRREQKSLLAAQAKKTEAEAEKTEAEADEVETATASKQLAIQQDQIEWQGREIAMLKARINELEEDKRDRLAEMAKLYETLMSALGRNRYLEAERARILRFLRSRYPDVYEVYQAECGEGVENGE